MDIEIKDLIGLKEPLVRLIEVIAQGVGKVSRSYLTRRNAPADAEKIRVISDAIDEAAAQRQIAVVYNDDQFSFR